MNIPSLALLVVLVAACRSAPPEASVRASAQTSATATPDGVTNDARARFFELTAEMHRIAQHVRLRVAIPLVDASRELGPQDASKDLAHKVLKTGEQLNDSVVELENAYRPDRFADGNSYLRDVEDLAFALILASREAQATGSETARRLATDLEKRSHELLDLVGRARAILTS